MKRHQRAALAAITILLPLIAYEMVFEHWVKYYAFMAVAILAAILFISD